MFSQVLVTPPSVTEDDRKAFDKLPGLADCLQVALKNSQTVAVSLRDKQDGKDSEDSKDRAKRFVCLRDIYVCALLFLH